MALGTKDLLSLSDEHDSDRSLPLNMLLCLLRVLCSGWWLLSKIVSNLLRLLLSATVVRQSVQCQQQLPPFSPACPVAPHPASLCYLPSTPQHRRGHWQQQTPKTCTGV